MVIAVNVKREFVFVRFFLDVVGDVYISALYYCILSPVYCAEASFLHVYVTFHKRDPDVNMQDINEAGFIIRFYIF